jgi:hypothetical protein
LYVFGPSWFYTLPDPTGARLIVNDRSALRNPLTIHNSPLPSDAYSGVLEQDLSPELEAALAGQGAITDTATGLVHLGGGRFYDPALGRPLQPNPIGGPPTAPQALNRYAATPVGQPGVGEAAQSGNQLLSTFEKSVFKSALTYFGFRPLQITMVPKVPAWGPLSLRMSQYA